MPRILQPTPATVAEAADVLRAGGVVAFPTETVYGLGAATFDEAAVASIFRIKGRPADNPLIAHVATEQAAARIAGDWDQRCQRLAERFWPGPLTLVVVRAGDVPALATAGLPTIAVRCPRHPVALDLLAAFGGPVSAPSANRSGAVSPTTASHVAEDLRDADDLIVLDGGRCPVGIESTVLDLTASPPRVLRPGSVTAAELQAVLGEISGAGPPATQDVGPGTSPAHYAPRTPATMLDRERLAAALAARTGPAAVLCFRADQVPPPHRALEMPQGAADYARQLYEALRQADAWNMSRILIERPPGTNEIWKAVLDRLERATGGKAE